MMRPTRATPDPRGPLRVHLLGLVDFEEALRLQWGLVYRLNGGEDGAALVLCEHPPLITLGRHSGRPIPLLTEEVRDRGWPMRWVGRGGGAVLHLPGQLAIYPVLPLDRLGMDVGGYLGRLHGALLDVLDDFGIRGEGRPGEPGVWVAGRFIATVGVALRHRVTTFGAVLNVEPDLTQYRVLSGGWTFTSLARERGGPVRSQLVRQRLIEHFAGRLGYEQIDMVFPSAGQPGHERLEARR
ncbi:MAG: hypothetical protein U0797_02055 [Gemmataceae bacterium]